MKAVATVSVVSAVSGKRISGNGAKYSHASAATAAVAMVPVTTYPTRAARDIGDALGTDNDTNPAVTARTTSTCRERKLAARPGLRSSPAAAMSTRRQLATNVTDATSAMMGRKVRSSSRRIGIDHGIRSPNVTVSATTEGMKDDADGGSKPRTRRLIASAKDDAGRRSVTPNDSTCTA